MHFTENRVAQYFIDTVLRDPDKSISVYGEGEEADVEQSREHFTVLDNMGQCDFDDVQVWSDKEERYVAWFQFVYGNVTSTSEAIEVISDYSANEYADGVIKRVEWCTE
tara:strand:+ start:326 stop:652 length:327 start_codon:yes stop_codon:yes gene_type:complete